MYIPVRVWPAALLFAVAGCISVPTERSFQDMEALATERLAGVESLSRSFSEYSVADLLTSQTTSSNLTADAAVRIALSNNHRIHAAYERLDMAAAERLATRLLKNPEADASVIVSEEDSSEDVIELGAEVDLLHMILLPKRSRIGAAEYAAIEMDVARTVQRLAYDTRVAYYRLLAAQQRLVMRKTVLQAADAARDMAGRLRDAGNIKELDKLNRDALYEQAALAVSSAELAVTEAREDLNVLMGLSENQAAWQTSGHLPEPTAEAFAQEAVITNALANSLQLSVTRKRIHAAAERLGVARAESAIPALHVGVDAEREPDGTWLVGPMVAVELPLFNFGQARRPAAEAALRKLRHEYAAQAVEIAAAARTAVKRVDVADERTRRYRMRLLPLQKEVMHRTQLQYNAMQLGVFQLLQAKQMEIGANSAYIDELLNYWIARIELEQIRNGLLVKRSGTAPIAADIPMGGGGEDGH
jgi:outer membrane protein TolC